jgi:hypothetical protein
LEEKNNNNLPWSYVNTFFQNPIERNIKTNFRKDLRINVSFPIIHSEQRIFSLNWLQKNKEQVLPGDCIVWINQDGWACRILPFSIFLLVRTRSILKSGFDSVQRDFTHALYRIILRGGRIEIEPEWIEWLLNTLGLSRKNARVRIYLIQEEKKGFWIKQVVGLEKEAPTILLDFLLYLRSWKRKVLFLKEKNIVTLSMPYPSPTLLVGTPGTGKTSLVRTLANEAKVPVVYQCLSSFTDASDNFTSFGFGRTVIPRAVQRGFWEARTRIPVVFFLDEIDALRINRSVSSSLISATTENEFTLETSTTSTSKGRGTGGEKVLGLGQLLVEVDRKQKNTGVALFRATNRPRELDPAVVRPGRFNQVLVMPLPDKSKRRAILKLYLERLPYPSERISQNKRRWEKWLTLTKGKSPSYLMALRSAAALNKRVQRPNFSLEQSFETVWRRIETSTRPYYSKRKSSERGKYHTFRINNFFESYYRKMRIGYWKENLVTTRGRPQVYYKSLLKEKTIIRRFFRKCNPLFFNSERQVRKNLVLVEKRRSYDQEKNKMCKCNPKAISKFVVF